MASLVVFVGKRWREDAEKQDESVYCGEYQEKGDSEVQVVDYEVAGQHDGEPKTDEQYGVLEYGRRVDGAMP